MIVMYATTKDGEGFVEKIGEFDNIYEVEIRCGMFDKDVVISFEEEEKDEKD